MAAFGPPTNNFYNKNTTTAIRNDDDGTTLRSYIYIKHFMSFDCVIQKTNIVKWPQINEIEMDRGDTTQHIHTYGGIYFL